jgi:hypothetical protein
MTNNCERTSVLVTINIHPASILTPGVHLVRNAAITQIMYPTGAKYRLRRNSTLTVFEGIRLALHFKSVALTSREFSLPYELNLRLRAVIKRSVILIDMGLKAASPRLPMSEDGRTL